MTRFVLLLAFWTTCIGTSCDLFADDENVANAQNSSETLESAEENDAFHKALKKTRAPWLSKDAEDVVYLPKPERRALKVPEEHNWDFSGVKTALKVLYWIVVAVCFTVAIVLIVRFIAINKGRWGSRTKWKDAINRARRLETLAPEARARFDDLLEAAMDALERNDLRNALIFYFSWILVELDKRELVFLDKGKTNLEYLRELKDVEPSRSIYRATMREFERVYYGGRPISREEFDAVWRLRESLESTLREKDALAESQNAQGARFASLLLTGTLILSCFLSGCSRREKTWNSSYASPAYADWNDEVSLNGVDVFERYCRSKFGRVGKPSRSVNGKNYDAIIVFHSPTSSSYTSNLFGVGWDLQPSPYEELSPKERSAMLQKYVDSTEDDWNRLARPRSVQLCSAEIEEWLKAKKGRTFVWVLSGHSYELEYWRKARERLVAENSSSLEECDEQIRRLVEAEKCARLQLTLELAKRRNRAGTLLLQETLKSEQGDEASKETEDAEENEAPVDFSAGITPSLTQQKIERYFTPDDFWRNDFRIDGRDYDLAPKSETQKIRSSQFLIQASTAAIEPRLERFSGEPTWTKNLPKERLSTETRRLEAQVSLETLLALGDVPLVQRLRVGEGQVLVVNSTSFLSNYAMLDPTNRAIASRLTDEFNKDGNVAFCYGSFGGFFDKGRQIEVDRGKFSLTKLSPFTIFIWHAFLLTTLVFFYFFPIWGRARRMRRERVEDFGLHVDATARLLKECGGVEWAREHIEAFRASEQSNDGKRF